MFKEQNSTEEKNLYPAKKPPLQKLCPNKEKHREPRVFTCLSKWPLTTSLSEKLNNDKPLWPTTELDLNIFIWHSGTLPKYYMKGKSLS